eukprot:1731047-Amphidinium_carterae.1
MTSKGHSIWLNREDGYILQKGSAIQEQKQKYFQQLVKQHRWGGSLELTINAGVGATLSKRDGSRDRGS